MNAYVWALIAAFIWGVVPVLEKIGLAKVDPYVGLFYRCLGVVVGAVLLGVFVLKPFQVKQADLKTILILMASGLLASIAAQIAFYHALKLGDVSRVVPVAAAYILISFVLGIVFLAEEFSFTKLIGMIMILGGVWLLKW